MENTRILPFISKPGRYLGHEYNVSVRSWSDTRLHCVLIFPDIYEIGMSHQGLQILYHILNGRPDILAERCYCPDRDVEKLLKAGNLPLPSLETDHSLRDFDIVGFTLPYELCYTNILTILDLAGIPFRAADRDETFPLVMGGGSCSLNPEPVADFFDIILLGDGEEAIVEITDMILQAKLDGMPRSELLLRLADIEGVYIPSFFRPDYDEQGRIASIAGLMGRTEVRRRILPVLDEIEHLKNPLVPHAKIVHDRLGLEIARGCTRGCRFCQAGIIYRPVRERSPEQIMELARCGIANSGFEELALLSLSTGDYSCLSTLLPDLMDAFAKGFVSVSMPSMRVGTLTPAVMDQIKRVRKTGFTLAPEAGSERLRQVINKGISEEDLLATSRDAFALGWNTIKLYFMIGLPTETMEDVEAIAGLARKTKQEGDRCGRGRRQINVSVGTFVPKPHTPFQWERQIGIDESKDRISRLRDAMPRNCKLKWHDPNTSFLEGVFSRGDRRLSVLLETAWQNGARLDAWSDHFQFGVWQRAAELCGIGLEPYLRAREREEILPWQHLHCGATPEFLQTELENAHQLVYTPDCRYHGCQQCGVCDFKTVKPIVHGGRNQDAMDGETGKKDADGQAASVRICEERHFKYMVTYERLGNICYLGHLEILQLIFRALRRAGIKTNFSQGFNPSPKVSFGPALPVGMESLAEYFVMDLPEPLPDPLQAARLLDAKLPQGLRILDISLHSGHIPQDTINTYRIVLPRDLTAQELQAMEAFRGAGNFPVMRERKGKSKEIDIRPLVPEIATEGADTVIIRTISRAGIPGIKVQHAMEHIFGIEEAVVLAARMRKTAWSPFTDK
ncbi:MAG: TIGR03960 family B12-binding radical SAM protein [Desulfocapsaceae bacterium]|nr:TIGR03960 family B12-binding radical SAM protein [Desulfocapsaceae bacterium]